MSRNGGVEPLQVVLGIQGSREVEHLGDAASRQVLRDEGRGEQMPHRVELLKLLREHDEINVVVPGDEPLVAHRPQEGAAGQNVFDVVLAAEAVEHLEHVGERELQTPQVLLVEHAFLLPAKTWRAFADSPVYADPKGHHTRFRSKDPRG